ncbi:MAG: hypothetical protein LBD04_02205 [Synergistaceae bacterium]|nr:hypothetical protein [Synergistaceae bacterium]
MTRGQLRRLRSKYDEKGEEGLIHGNRGRKTVSCSARGTENTGIVPVQ